MFAKPLIPISFGSIHYYPNLCPPSCWHTATQLFWCAVEYESITVIWATVSIAIQACVPPNAPPSTANPLTAPSFYDHKRTIKVMHLVHNPSLYPPQVSLIELYSQITLLHPIYDHEQTSKLCNWFITRLLTCPKYFSLNSSWGRSLYNHEQTSKLCTWFITHLFACLRYPSSNSTV